MVKSNYLGDVFISVTQRVEGGTLTYCVWNTHWGRLLEAPFNNFY